ncbi:MAG: DUF6882 domain-containing protein [Planctomycetota bacterium]|jgi:hypothetical protein
MTDDEYRAFVQKCYEYLQEQQDFCRMDWGIGSFSRWDMDQHAGELVFSNSEGPRVVCKMQIAGTYSNESRTWLWSWNNASIQAHLKEAATIARRFGQEHGIDELTTAKWDADEADAWAMTAVTANLVQAKGAYRGEDESGLTFMLMMDVRREE